MESNSPYVYDAVSILGFGDESDTDLPEAGEGEVIIRYGGWSLQELRDSSALIHKEDWYNSCDWSTEKLPSGIYRVRLPIQGSNRNGIEEQKKLLLPGEDPAHIVWEATALLCHKMKTGADLLKSEWVRTHHPSQGGGFAELHWHDGRLGVDGFFGDSAGEHVWFGGSARIS